MDKEFFLPSLQYNNAFTNSIPQWQTLSSMEIQSSQPSDCFLSTPPPPPTSTTDNFESALSSMVSSPAASNSALSNENFMIRELIGKLGNICNTSQGQPPPYIGGGGGGGNCSTNNSCYSTPINSPPKMNISMPIIDHLVKENFPTLGNSIALSSNLPAMPGDPGFAERAARFSSFGSRSFNGRTSQFKVNNNINNNGEVGYGSNTKLQRVSSSPSLKAAGSLAENNKNSLVLQSQGGNCGQQQGEFINSPENSSVSRQNQVGENGSNRKRKAVAPKAKNKDSQSQSPSNATKGAQNVENSSAKRTKSEEGHGEAKTEENKRDDGKKQNDSNQKPPEPQKDYIHVRARRGQATDSHSLAERVRREKISERMKLLQDLVPGCDKVTGKALMLDEIINYVQSLQRQVEFLSMKLANVNPRVEFNNMGNLFSKDVIQPNSTMPHPMYPLDSLASPLYGQPHQNPLQDSIPTTAPCPMDPLSLNPTINQNHALLLPTIDGFPNGLPQLPSLCEGDLQTIVEMGDKRKMHFNHNLYMGQIHHH